MSNSGLDLYIVTSRYHGEYQSTDVPCDWVIYAHSQEEAFEILGNHLKTRIDTLARKHDQQTWKVTGNHGDNYYRVKKPLIISS
jgi:hypothetical protein